MGLKEATVRLERISETTQALRDRCSAQRGPLSATEQRKLTDAVKLLILDLECLLAELGEDLRQKPRQ